jgi:nicotinamide-nucleotide amidase
MKVMWDLSVLPDIIKLVPSQRFIQTIKVNTFGRGESTVAEELGELFDRTRNPKVGTTVANGIVSVRIRSEFDTEEKARTELLNTIDQVKQAVGCIAYSTEDTTLQEVLVQMLMERKLTMATAESCTGGLIAKMLTDIAGSSAAVKGGWVTYANEMKMRELGVPQQMLMEHGASVTGIAGPDGGTTEKPVGTVWMGIADRNGVTARKFLFNGTRETVRDRTAKMACQMLRLRLLGEDDAAMTIG